MRSIIFSSTLLISSFLLFLVQPMIGRMLLPSLGGTPAVWNGCMLFFQAVLLCGYAWAHYGPPRLGMRNHLLIHLSLLGIVCFLLPMRLYEGWAVPVDSNPLGWLIGQLALCVGLPFFVISSSAPLLQRWFSASGNQEKDKDPWFLYAVSNFGSLAALVSYPFVFERLMGLTDQGWFWTGGFFALATLFVVCGWYTLRNTDPQMLRRSIKTHPAAPLNWKQRARYVVLAAIPSSLMLGVTTVVSTEVGSFPLMWSIPLALYLLTFVFVFSKRTVIPHYWMVKALPVLLLLMPLFTILDPGNSPIAMLCVHFGTFFVVAMVCHGELARLRPPVSQLTEFYLMMSIGGVLGGAINSLVAPALFNSILEYPLMLVAACLVMPIRKDLINFGSALKNKIQIDAGANPGPNISTRSSSKRRQDNVLPGALSGRTFWHVCADAYQNSTWLGPASVAMALAGAWVLIEVLEIPGSVSRSLVAFGLPALVCFTLVDSPRKFAVGYAFLALICPLLLNHRDVVSRQRGFFGVNEVALADNGTFRTLVNGRTLHGMQRTEQIENPDPLTYYDRKGPIGDVFGLYGSEQTRVGIVGLGVGSIAAYSSEGQRFDFYEIDPVVCQIAQNPNMFTFLSSSRGDVHIVLGDARIQLEALRGRATPIHPVNWISHRPGNDQSNYGLIILDAFGSDAVPLHLLTAEAVQLYLDLLDENGLLVFHISSKFIDFIPVGVGIAEHFGLQMAVRFDQLSAAETKTSGRQSSTYMIMSKDIELVRKFVNSGRGWKPPNSSTKYLWTDERANVLDAIKW